MVRSLRRRTFAAAAVLSGVAGFVDGFGFVYVGGYFVSFMSGNTTRASVDLTSGSFVAAGGALLLIGAFVAGAMAGTALFADHPRRAARVLCGVGLALAAAAVSAWTPWTWLTGGILAFSMGAMNTVFARNGEVPFGITYMTGALVKFAQGLVQAWRGDASAHWLRHLLLWASIALGAVLGAGAYALIGEAALWLPPALLAVLLTIPAARAWLRL